VGTTDDLTGLPSARAFAFALERQTATARRHDRPGAVVMLAGAASGDAGCRAVARLLRERLRATDLVTRIAGSEFALLLPELREDAARALACELVALVERASGAPAAAGVACFPDGLDRPQGALLADADVALAAAHFAQPAVVVFDARVQRSHRSAGSRAGRLRRALAEDGIELEPRPVIDLRNGAIDHLAVTLRPTADELWDGDRDALRALGERFGLGAALDRHALAPALAGAGGKAVLVVPLGASAVGDRGFADWLVRALGEHPETAVRLVLSVPEETAYDDLAAVRSLAVRAAEFGVRLALDGFGRLGAFALLKALPVHQVRLDPGLVRGLSTSDRERAIVLGIVQAAEALGVATVATGVDREPQLTAVRGFGIPFAQGHCMSLPPSTRQVFD
jgi:diguanylate cyclase (GGDEF)-like protein